MAARHLHFYGYAPTVYYPKPSKPDLFVRLQRQLHNLHVAFTEDFAGELAKTDLIVDALFGFSFKPPVRAPFDDVIRLLESTDKPVLAVDIPSSWDVEDGPPSSSQSRKSKDEGEAQGRADQQQQQQQQQDQQQNQDQLGAHFMPNYLISLTAAKPCVRFFRGPGRRHFLGGRFLSRDVAAKYGLDLPEYQGIDQIVEVPVDVKVEKL